jgi:hypothetical protein
VIIFAPLNQLIGLFGSFNDYDLTKGSVLNHFLQTAVVLFGYGKKLLFLVGPDPSDCYYWLSNIFVRLAGLLIIVVTPALLMMIILVYMLLVFLAFTGWGTLLVLLFPKEGNNIGSDSTHRRNIIWNQWYQVFMKYLIFLQVSLFGYWNGRAYNYFGIYQPEYIRDMNEEHLVKDPDDDKLLIFRPSALISSLISIRASIYLLIPYCSFICVYCRFTAGHPLLGQEKRFTLKTGDKKLREDNLRRDDCDEIQLKYLDMICYPDDQIMKLKKSDGYLYYIEYVHLFVDRSRVIQWGIGLYSLVVTVGLLCDS